jgi:hypothetical protein
VDGKGERGARGEDAPTIVNWTIDRVHYRAVPTLSNGKAGPPIELRELLQQFLDEGVTPLVDAAIKDAARR